MDLTTEYRKKDSYKTKEIKEVLRHLKDEHTVPYSKLEATFIQGNGIIADIPNGIKYYEYRTQTQDK